jgi:hypothetical protein
LRFTLDDDLLEVSSMSRWNLRILAAFGLFFVLVPLAAAAPPPGTTSNTEPRPPFDARKWVRPDFQTLGVSRPVATFEGTVLDINDRAVSNVQVKLFVDGELIGGGVTDGTGSYDFTAFYDMAGEDTALLWFIASERTLTPKALVLRESRRSQENRLISRCIPRAAYIQGQQFRVYLFDAANRNKELSELECLD